RAPEARAHAPRTATDAPWTAAAALPRAPTANAARRTGSHALPTKSAARGNARADIAERTANPAIHRALPAPGAAREYASWESAARPIAPRTASPARRTCSAAPRAASMALALAGRQGKAVS